MASRFLLIAALVALTATTLCVSVSATTTSDDDATVDIHPYSLQMAASVYGEPQEKTATDFVRDVGSAAVESRDPEAMAVVNRFVQEALQLHDSKYGALGYKWRQLQAKMHRIMARKISKAAAKLAKRTDRIAAFAAAGAHHGLTPIEYKYMREYQRYQRLRRAYHRGCVRSRFWLRLHKWHWRVLLAGDKKLKELVKRYKLLQHRDNTLKHRLNEQFAFARGHAGYKSYRFFSHVVALSKHGLKSTEQRARYQHEKNRRLKRRAARLAQKISALKQETSYMQVEPDHIQQMHIDVEGGDDE